MTFRACIRCGHEGVGTFCPACGVRQDGPEARDPAIGRVIADRYEILAPIKEGGMGQIYVALQRTLKRKVALKLIRPSMASVDRIADRFLVEAQAASQLNHPNVVSIYDFGQSGDGASTELYLVMELLAGSDLRELIDSGAELPPERIVDVLRQTLAGLAEAHDHGISHRDIKPDNIFLESTRRGTDRVKLIDFGVARVEREESLTLAGQFVGTPWYSAPEQVHGAHGPLSDIYSVGVVLYEMLTGDVPFDDPSPVQILIKHQTAPRPDPVRRAVGKRVPRALAEACLRAMAIKPERRYPSAEAMADALLAAQNERVTVASKGSIFPHRSARSSVPAAPRKSEPASGVEPALDFGILESILPRAPSFPLADSFPLLGRDDDLAWAEGVLAGDERCAIVHGRPGVGRSRFLRELARTMEAGGVRSVVLAAHASPRNQIGYLGLRELITAVSGRSIETLAAGADAPEPAASGLRAIFTEGHVDGLAESRSRVSAAVQWAFESALDEASGTGFVLFVDDADRLDGASMLALGDALKEAPLPGLTVFMTSVSPTEMTTIKGVVTRELCGLSPEDVASLLATTAQLLGTTQQPRVSRVDSVEPLYLEHAWAYLGDDEDPPATLEELIAARVEGLFPVERRALQALAVMGECSVEELSVVLNEAEVDETVQSLVDARFAEVALGIVRIAHRVISERVIALAPAGTIAGLHASAYEALPFEPGLLELRAFHSARGRADFETFLLVEEATRLRTLRGDADGAVMMLVTGLDGTITRSRRGDFAAQSAEKVFIRKLGAALLTAGYPEQVITLLEAALGDASLVGTERALALEQLALAYAAMGRGKHAESLRAEALVLANASGDRPLIERLTAPFSAPSRAKRPHLCWAPYGAKAPMTKSVASMRRVSVERVAVRSDPRRDH